MPSYMLFPLLGMSFPGCYYNLDARLIIESRSINLSGLIDIYRTLDLTSAKYTFHSGIQGTFIKKDNTLVHTTSLSIFKRIHTNL